ncbi:hypothetical protein FH972_004322 [Carpinus fangiana]|uniref:Uncharacterized protein n=1 Tax=Carpinus fangiana TaxID=176857 RepID=A0A5N6QNI0_9ROSI|nr:hypothetical protein FH972_004322 [Carpinus fangiana]
MRSLTSSARLLATAVSSRGYMGVVGWRFCKGEARLGGESDGLTGGSILPGGSVTHAREDNLAGSKAWSASMVAERLVKETHWFSKFCRTRPDDVAEEGAYSGELLLRGRGQAKGNQSCNGWTSVGEDNQPMGQAQQGKHTSEKICKTWQYAQKATNKNPAATEKA